MHEVGSQRIVLFLCVMPVNCGLRSVSAMNDAVLRTPSANKKVKVTDRIAHIQTLFGVAIPRGKEMLLSYGDEFWSNPVPSYCAMCFSRTENSENPLVLCSEGSCNRARHRLCFSAPVPSLSHIRRKGVQFFCPDHLREAHGANLRLDTRIFFFFFLNIRQ